MHLNGPCKAAAIDFSVGIVSSGTVPEQPYLHPFPKFASPAASSSCHCNCKCLISIKKFQTNAGVCLSGEDDSPGICISGSGHLHQQANHAAAATTAAAAAATAALDAQLQSAEQQNQELQSQLHHKAMRVANAEAAQKSAESERDAMAQENARLEELVSCHQQVHKL